jgi:hypothetical protein
VEGGGGQVPSSAKRGGCQKGGLPTPPSGTRHQGRASNAWASHPSHPTPSHPPAPLQPPSPGATLHQQPGRRAGLPRPPTCMLRSSADMSALGWVSSASMSASVGTCRRGGGRGRACLKGRPGTARGGMWAGGGCGRGGYGRRLQAAAAGHVGGRGRGGTGAHLLQAQQAAEAAEELPGLEHRGHLLARQRGQHRVCCWGGGAAAWQQPVR